MTDPHIGGNIDDIAPSVSEDSLDSSTGAKQIGRLFFMEEIFICGDSSVYSTSEQDITEVADTLLAGTEKYQHFGVIGNHDEEDLDFPRMKQYLEQKYRLHFAMTQPRYTPYSSRAMQR